MDIEQYIKRTRGCTLSEDETHSKCNNFINDTMHSFNWAENLEPDINKQNLVEIRFKSNRKGIFNNIEELFLKKGDIVAVEATSGHDIGIINLTGEVAYWKAIREKKTTELPKVYRKARPVDIEKWEEAIRQEETILNRTKTIIKQLKLEMKLGDVEFQGDGTKATFFYTANDRVDFRELIKLLAQEFKLRVEMRQIGARQESARIGGIGTCGMELCCIRWKNNFESVTTNSARYQELSLNPTKLAGQCGKLKCCLNYEVNAYIEARELFPNTSIPLKTKNGNAYFQKSDVFKKNLWYSFDNENSTNTICLTIDRVNEIIEMNKKGQTPDTLEQNKLELSDLISTKHNVKISSQEVKDSKNINLPTRKKKKKTNRRYKNKNQNNYRNNSRNNNKNKK
ncbi:MAG: regulatory iron-sulfur-containing complex subunit RicT [Bacteroidota bacterium]|nr:regulatory iron-sulfur-containing complex subunit RicT [Bacteroidota bacterium]